MKKITPIIFLTVLSLFGKLSAQSFVEEFETVAPLPVGWDTTNLSSPMGTTGWFQGTPIVFPAKSLTGYIGANYINGSSVATISNWLFAPVQTLNNGDMIHFYTRTRTSSIYPDRMQVRLSQNGASVDVGTSATTVGDFTTSLLDINPTYLTPGSGGYPDTWTMYMLTLSGLPGAGVSGRFAFRYFVENGGTAGTRSDYIGIDSVAYISILTVGVENTVSSAISVYPNPATDKVQVHFDSATPAARTVTITDIVGRIVFQQVFNDTSISIDVAELNTGSYILTTKSEDGVGVKKLVIE